MELDIIVEAVQYTPGYEPVIVQYTTIDPAGGKGVTMHLHTTQTDLGDGWDDDSVKGVLIDHLDKQKIVAKIDFTKTDKNKKADTMKKN